MKNKFIFFIVFLLVIPISFGQCENYLDVYLQLVSLTDQETLSKYQFPEFREGDLLAINNITLVNPKNCNITNPDIKIELINDKGSSSFLGWSDNFHTTIVPNGYYTIFRNDSKYLNSKGEIRAFSEVPLNEIGQWKVKISGINIRSMKISGIENKEVRIARYDNFVLFRVFTSTDLELRELTKETKNLARQSNFLSFSNIKIAFIIGIGGIFISIIIFWGHLLHDTSKDRKNQENALITLLLELSHIAGTSESYKDIFIQNIVKKKQSYSKNEEINKYLENEFNKYIKIIDDNNLVSNIHKEFQSDKLISENIKALCLVLITQIEKHTFPDIFNIDILLPHYRIRQLNNDFYLEYLDFRIRKFETLTLKNFILKLSKEIETINYQIEYVNSNINLKREDRDRWHGFYYRIFLNLHHLDGRLSIAFKKLLEYDRVKLYYEDKLKEIEKYKKSQEEIKDETLEYIEVLNRIYQRFEK